MIVNKQNIDIIDNIQTVASNEGVILLIEKPKDWTSFDVVAKVRNLLKIKKVGHAGTLDPLATGLLLLGLGKGTKLLTELTQESKSYHAVIKLGATTKTYDSEAEEENQLSIPISIKNELIESTIKSFLGEQMQTPPIYSAKRVNGKKAYQLARRGEEFKLEANKITIYKLEKIEIDLPFVSFQVECSKGTYIRSLANDIGNSLELGAYLYDLKRTSIGEFSNKDSIELNHLINLYKEKQ